MFPQKVFELGHLKRFLWESCWVFVILSKEIYLGRIEGRLKERTELRISIGNLKIK